MRAYVSYFFQPFFPPVFPCAPFFPVSATPFFVSAPPDAVVFPASVSNFFPLAFVLLSFLFCILSSPYRLFCDSPNTICLIKKLLVSKISSVKNYINMKFNKLKNNVTRTALTLQNLIDKALKVSAAQNQEQPVISKRSCFGSIKEGFERGKIVIP
jgi:hypothetical protein